MGALTRKYGPLPGWAYGALAGAALLAFWYLRRGQGQPAGSTPASLAASPAASTIPYVPSVTVTGIPQGAPSTPSTSSGGPRLQVRQAQTSGPYAQYDQGASGVPVYLQPGAGPIGTLPFGSSVSTAGDGTPQTGPSNGFTTTYWPVSYAGVTAWVGANDVSGGGSGGQGGWGYAGQPGASAIGGWTVGWTPAAAGPATLQAGRGGQGGPSTANRRQVPRPLRQRRLWGGSGGQDGQGGSARANRAQPGRPLRRRAFSGR